MKQFVPNASKIVFAKPSGEAYFQVHSWKRSQILPFSPINPPPPSFWKSLSNGENEKPPSNDEIRDTSLLFLNNKNNYKNLPAAKVSLTVNDVALMLFLWLSMANCRLGYWIVNCFLIKFRYITGYFCKLPTMTIYC